MIFYKYKYNIERVCVCMFVHFLEPRWRPYELTDSNKIWLKIGKVCGVSFPKYGRHIPDANMLYIFLMTFS